MKPPRSLWPWAIIFAFGIFISGTASLIVLACSQRVDLVSSNYYEQEIRFQEHLDKLRRTQQHGLKADVAYDAASENLTFSLPSDQASKAASGSIQLYRPSAAGLDREVALKTDTQGKQSLSASGLKPGLWKIRVSWVIGDVDYFIDQRIIIPSRTPTHPAPL